MPDPPPNPSWHALNLQEHYEKHVVNKPECFESLVNPPATAPLTETDYERRSRRTVHNAWCEYRSEHWDRNGGYKDPGYTFVDDQLVKAVVSDDRRRFITCFHLHFRKGRCTERTQHTQDMLVHVPVGERRDMFIRQLERWKEEGLEREVRIDRPGDTWLKRYRARKREARH